MATLVTVPLATLTLAGVAPLVNAHNGTVTVPVAAMTLDVAEVTVGTSYSKAEQNSASEWPGNETWAHTVDEGTNCLVVAVGMSDTRDVAVATWDGNAMTELIDYNPETTGARRVVVLYYLNPEPGTKNIYVEMEPTNFGRFGASALNLKNVDTSDPFGTPDTDTVADGIQGFIDSGFLTGTLLLSVCQMGYSSGLTMKDGNGQIARDGRDSWVGTRGTLCGRTPRQVEFVPS